LKTTIDSELVVHELGHIFDLITGREFSDAVDLFGGDAGRTGFSLRKSNSPHEYEVAADDFLNWVLVGSLGQIQVI